MARPEKIRLGEILVRQNFMNPAQLEQALEEQRKTGRRLGRVIAEKGYASERQIAEAVAHQLNIPFLDLGQYELDVKQVHKLPEVQARRFRAILLEEKINSFVIGMVDPSDVYAYDELVRLLKRDIEIVVVQESLLMQTIDRSYRLTEEISSLALELQEDLAASNVDLASLMGVDLGIDDAPVVKLLQTIFEDAVQVRASDIHIEPQENKLLIRFRIDGVMHFQTQSDIKIVSALIMRLKIMAGLDISEKRLPQDGRFGFTVKGKSVDMRISTMPTQYGETVVMRLLIQNTAHFQLDNLGMPAPLLASFRRMIQRPSGMVLVTGPTGSGKTTTLYSALNELNTPETKVITVEDPVEYRLPGIIQTQVNEKIELDFPRLLRSILRQDPDIVLVGEMRDEETAQTGLRAAMTGHLVLSTLHTNDASTAPVRLIDMGVPRFMVAMSLLGVLAQRLLRLVCPHCAVEHTPTESEATWLRQVVQSGDVQGTFRHGRGCQHCNRTGYLGRVGLYEFLEMTNDLAMAANMQDTNIFIQKARERLQGKTLRDQSLQLALQGKTTLDEIMRADNQFEE
ncbi:GspE/PulE family protein [Methylophilus aquaticus]|uniref:GspE/PulE family protein n=1 Tax=Methylophilus aquaticus TaxID=1971610 RepID=A0ABT9JR79_9PROT|nr:GspE/PulE family protein [Methylophilus aquaticus]MDP8566636.1 GspE/PulE family protein [Methylophilus aquaticus]